MRHYRMRLILVTAGLVLFSGMLQGCNVVEDILRGLARICEQPELLVAKTADTNDGLCTTGDCSLREAVITANNCPGPQTIRLPAGHYSLTLAGAGEDQARTGDLDILDDLTIIGVGAPSISGENQDRIFEVFSPATVDLNLLILINGQEQLGGALRNHGDLTVRSSSIHDNVAVVLPGGVGSSSGGGVFNESGTLTLLNTQVFDNLADNGGGVTNFATATLVAQDVLLQGNQANDSAGGLWNNTAANATLTNVDMRMNQAGADAGGVFNAGGLEAMGGTFSENVAAGRGGGLYVAAAGETFFYDIWFTNNNAGRGGAAFNQGLLHLYRVGVNNNTAFSGQGGGLANVRHPAAPAGDPGALLLLRNVTVSGNMLGTPSTPGGAGLYNEGGSLRIEFSTFAYNSPDGVLSTGGPEIGFRSTILAYHAGGNCSGISAVSGGYNLEDADACGFAAIGDQPNTDPLLMPLASYGGPSLSHALSLGSPAIDAGDRDRCVATDQRGVARPQGARCDVGAIELEPGGEAPPPMPGDTEPTGAEPTATPTSIPPSPISMNFNADRYSLVAGACTKLRWEVKNAEQVYLDGEPVLPLEAEDACLQQTTTYSLRASNAVEEVEKFVTIEITARQKPPQAPGQLGIGNRVCNDQAYTVTLSWIDVADNEDGYRVYRNGNLIATLGANETGYTDNPPYGGPYTYGAEAFNEAGASARPTVQEAGCIY